MAKELPKLPYGEGTLSWGNEEHTCIYYRKQITVCGVKKRIHVTGKTVTECRKLMKEEEEKFSKSAHHEASDITLATGMSKWLTLYKRHEVNERSYDRIESTFDTHIKDSDLGRMQELAIQSDLIQNFLNELKRQDGKPLSYSSKKKVYELLNQYFKRLYIKNPSNNPILGIKPPKKTNNEVLEGNEDLTIWSDEEMDLITKTGMSNFKNGTLVVFLMWTFCRVGELLALKWEDIDLSTKKVCISKSISRVRTRDENKAKYEIKVVPTKNKTKRTIKLCENAFLAISKYKESKLDIKPEDFVASDDGKTPLSLMSITRAYQSIVRKAKLSKDVTIHGLRHSGISYFLRNGVPIEVVSRMAGHSSIDITQNIYYSVLEEQKDKAIEDLDSIVRAKKRT